MSETSYTGRHRPAPQPSRGRRLAVPVTLLGATVVAAVVVRDVGASPLRTSSGAFADSARLAAMTSSRGAGGAADGGGAGSTAAATPDRADALAALAASRADSSRASRSAARAQASPQRGSVRAELMATEAAARARATAARAAATKAAAAKAAAARAAAATPESTRPSGVGGGTGNPGPDRTAGPIAGDRRWVSPFSGYSLTSGFGSRWGKMHNGQDLAAAMGTPVRALSSGKVLFAGWDSTGYGNFVKIQYWDGTVAWYAHNGQLTVSVGQSVAPGQTVALSGNSGNSTGPHLHLEIHPGGGGAVPPTAWLRTKGINL